MSRTLLSLALVAAACAPAPFVPGNDDTPTDSEGPIGDDTGGDTEITVDTADTDLVVNPPDTDGHSNLPKLDCHPYDPVSYGGWSRRYSLKVGGAGGGVEAHTSLGLTSLPGGASTAAPAYKVQVTNAGSNNYQANYWNHCSSSALQELAYTYTVQGRTLTATAGQPQKLLPDESEFDHTFQPTWTVDTNYQLKVPTGYNGPPNPLFGCYRIASGSRTVEAQYTGMGFEDIVVQGLGLVEAYHMTVILDQSQTLPNTFNPLCSFLGGAAGGNPFSLFFAFFQAAAGFTPSNPAEDGAYITAQIDRWYVRGVGLVKETSVDYLDQGRVLYEKNLTQCSGLPGCP